MENSKNTFDALFTKEKGSGDKLCACGKPTRCYGDRCEDCQIKRESGKVRRAGRERGPWRKGQ
jgi:hypothetical protein